MIIERILNWRNHYIKKVYYTNLTYKYALNISTTSVYSYILSKKLLKGPGLCIYVLSWFCRGSDLYVMFLYFKNKDGLLYVEVQFDAKTEKGNQTIHGEDEKTDYATVEFPMTASTHDGWGYEKIQLENYCNFFKISISLHLCSVFWIIKDD